MDRFTPAINNQGITDKNYTIYKFGTDAKMYIDGFYIKEANAIMYREHIDRLPYFGYDSQYFDYILEGRSYVSGTIGFNVYTPQVFYKILKALGYDYYVYKENSKDKSQLDVYFDSQGEEEIIDIILSQDYSKPNDDYEDFTLPPKYFDIRLVIQNEFEEIEHVLLIKDVYILGMQTAYSKDDQVIEFYNFIAKRISSTVYKEGEWI